MNQAASYVELEVDDGSRMRAYVARPGGPGPHPGILVFQEAFGVNDHIRDVANRFVAQGFVALAPELFHRTAPGFEGRYDDMETVFGHIRALTVEGQVADVRAAHAWLAAQEVVDPDRVAAVGYCMGGRAAYLANASAPLAAGISYYGGGIAPELLDRVPALHGPQLLFWAGQDRRILPEHYRSVEDALRAAGKRYASVVYSQAQHGFFSDQRSSYDGPAARESWALVLTFLQDYVVESQQGQ